MKLGYNTNGWGCHRWEDALEILAEIGYRSIALTIDYHCLNPYAPTLRQEIERMRRHLQRLQLECVIETGARYLLNPRLKHDPTLLSATPAERQRRIDFLIQCIDIAAELKAHAVSFWSGTPRESQPDSVYWERLISVCRLLCDHAEFRNVRLAFEPEPGMFLQTMSQFEQLAAAVDHRQFGLTLDIGHVHCIETIPLSDCVRHYAERLWNVHIEDMVRGVHEHLFFGEGEIDFPPVLSALRECGYAGGVHVELSRHSHAAPQTAQAAFDFLSNC